MVIIPVGKYYQYNYHNHNYHNYDYKYKYKHHYHYHYLYHYHYYYHYYYNFIIIIIITIIIIVIIIISLSLLSLLLLLLLLLLVQIMAWCRAGAFVGKHFLGKLGQVIGKNTILACNEMRVPNYAIYLIHIQSKSVLVHVKSAFPQCFWFVIDIWISWRKLLELSTQHGINNRETHGNQT